MAPSSSSSPVPSLHQSFHFTPIPECEEDDLQEQRCRNRATPSSNHRHTPTPLHQNAKPTNTKRHDSKFPHGDGYDEAVSCYKCRPHHHHPPHREKFSVLPLENQYPSLLSSPNLIIKSIFQSLTRKSPKPPPSTAPSPSSSSAAASREEQWRFAVAELSQKLIQATKRREEAILEASRLKSAMAELEKKLTKLEIYCHNLKSSLDECSNQKQSIRIRHQDGLNFNDRIIQQFLVSVSESRSSIRALSRSLASNSNLTAGGGKIYEKLSQLLQPFDLKIKSFAKNPKSLVIYLEALLGRAFFEGFEASGFQKSGSTRILDPVDRSESNYASFIALVGLTWDEVLSKGTKHFSEEFSRFCDRKMSDVVSMLSWNRAWSEPLLQAFFAASKSVWLVHLLANSVNPGLQIFRVEKGVRFDPVYMEELGGDRVRGLVRDSVRVMVQPGFYVYGSVVKCKVICKHCGRGDYNDRTVKECDRDNYKGISSPLGG